MAKKYRRVTLSRSTGGTVAIFVFLALVGCFMVLPIVYVLVTAFKPLNEILAYPPKFFVRSPTLNNLLPRLCPSGSSIGAGSCLSFRSPGGS